MVLFSCRTPTNFQKGKPFVYRTNIKLEGKFSNEEKQDLLVRLDNQLDDSLQAKAVTTFFDKAWPPKMWVFKKLDHPPVFDTLNVSRSILFMNALLTSIGYYTPVTRDSIRIDTTHAGKEKEQQRVTIDFTVRPGTQVKFDSVGFDLQTPALQELALKVKEQSYLKKGNPYSKQILSTEIGRLVDTFRNYGYYRFSREDLYVEHDTVLAALIDPSLDPIQQAELLETLKIKKENPTITVTVKQRNTRDSSHLIKYHIARVTVYPDLPLTEDTGFVHNDTSVLRNMTFITRSNKFKLPFVAGNVYLHPGALYKQENYFRTSNRFSQLSAWQYSNFEFENSPLGDSLLDVTLHLYPAKKQKLTVDLEASRNTNDIITASNLFGVGVNFGLQNRNAYKQSIQTNTNLRAGVELGSNFIETKQSSISHTIAIPHFIGASILPESWLRNIKNPQTLLNVNASYTDRYHFFTLRSINGSMGFQWAKNLAGTSRGQLLNKTRTFLWKLPNVEFTSLSQTDSLKEILKANPSLQLAFRTGLVIGQEFIYNTVRQKGNKTSFFLARAEESGATLGLIRSLDEGPLLRYILGEVEFRHHIDYRKTQLAFRAYGGAGLSYGRSGTGYEQLLPFYKAFFTGGPNSMRAWQVRRLGLGSSKFYNDTPNSSLDRFGDVKLEGNIEYRFLLGTLFGVKFRSAIFTDVGNVWDRHRVDTSAIAQGSDFNIGRFYKEFAVGMGTGLRLDFNYFLIRLDLAYKVRDPQRTLYPDRWFYGLSLGSGQVQLGINYPF
jgi:outer membrane protein insertion porin family